MGIRDARRAVRRIVMVLGADQRRHRARHLDSPRLARSDFSATAEGLIAQLK